MDGWMDGWLIRFFHLFSRVMDGEVSKIVCILHRLIFDANRRCEMNAMELKFPHQVHLKSTHMWMWNHSWVRYINRVESGRLCSAHVLHFTMVSAIAAAPWKHSIRKTIKLNVRAPDSNAEWLLLLCNESDANEFALHLQTHIDANAMRHWFSNFLVYISNAPISLQL